MKQLFFKNLRFLLIFLFFLIIFSIANSKAYAGVVGDLPCQPVPGGCRADCGQTVENLWSGSTCEVCYLNGTCVDKCCYPAGWCCLVCNLGDCPNGTEGEYVCNPSAPKGLTQRYPENDSYFGLATSSIDLQWSLSSWGSCCTCTGKGFRVRIGDLNPSNNSTWWNIYNKTVGPAKFPVNSSNYRYFTMYPLTAVVSQSEPYVLGIDQTKKTTYYWRIQAINGDANAWSSIRHFTYLNEYLPTATIYEPDTSVAGKTSTNPLLIMPGRDYTISGSANDTDSNLATLSLKIKKSYSSSNNYNALAPDPEPCFGNTCQIHRDINLSCNAWSSSTRANRIHNVKLEAWDFMPASNSVIGGRVDDHMFLELAPTVNLNFTVRNLGASNTSCSYQTPASGVKVVLKGVDPTNVAAGPVVLSSGTTDASGKVLFKDVPRQTHIGWSYLYSPFYQVEVDSPFQIGCTGGKVIAAASRSNVANLYLPSIGSVCGTINYTLGIKPPTPATPQPWTTAVDGDIFANQILLAPPSVASLVQGGFTNKLVNTNNATLVPKVFVLASQIIYNTINAVESGHGGFSANNQAQDYYLNNMSFISPNLPSVVSINTLSANMPADTVYKMPVATFNSLSPATYGVVGNGTSILYVEGNEGDEVTITNNITSTGGRLMLVSNVPINIGKNVGNSTRLVNFGIITLPHIMMGMITGKTFNILSSGNDHTVEIPVTFEGPVVGVEGFSSERDLGDENKNYPVQDAVYNAKYLYDISKLERSHKEVKSYTGLGIYDVNWIEK